jgi:O-antigen/teichoic acid export membrane protein
MTVYSADRVRRLRLVLGIVVALAVLLAVLAVFVLASGDDLRAGIFALVVAALLLGASATALTLLGEAGRGSKTAAVTTGVLCVLCGLALAGSWLAFLLPVLGLGLLFLALIPDDPETVP